MSRSTRRRRWLLLTASLLVALLIAEVTARVVIARWDAMPPPRPPADGDVLLVQMLQKSPHRDVIYELQPGLDCRFQGVRVQTNAAGGRGPEHTARKAPGAFRVLALGDSVLFGWGVPWPDTGVARLEERLRAAAAGREVDVVDTGVPGYNTAMEAALLRARAAELAPDVVLLDFVANDLDLPNFLLAPADPWRIDHCYLLDLARRAWRSSWLDPRTPFVWAPGDGAGRFESDPARVPAAYRHLVGPAAFARAMRDIDTLGRATGFHVLVTSVYELPPEQAAVCRDLGVPTVDVHARIDEWLRGGGDGNALRLSASDPHPTPLVHGFWADAVAGKLRELGWMPTR